MPRPRPTPPSSRDRPVSGRPKRSNACGRNPAGKPGPSSRYLDVRDRSRPPVPREHDRRAARREPQRIVQEVIDRLPDPVRRRHRRSIPSRPSTRQLTPAAASREAAIPALRASSFPMSVGLQPQAEPVLVAPGQQQQVIGEPGQPFGFRPGVAHRGGQLVPAAARTCRQLELAAEHRQRGSAARGRRRRRRRAAWPAPVAAGRAAHSSCWPARRSRPGCPAPRRLYPGARRPAALGYRGHLPSQPLHRGQGRPRQPVGAQRRDGDEDDPADREFPRDLALRRVVGVPRLAAGHRNTPGEQPAAERDTAPRLSPRTRRARRSRIGICYPDLPLGAAGTPCP